MIVAKLKRCGFDFTSVVIFALQLLLACITYSSARATPTQEEDKLRYGANSFRIAQLPLTQIIKESKIQLTVTESTNNKGYTASWEVQGNMLFLVKFNAEHRGKSVNIDKLIPSAKLPLRARWFTGNIQLPIGEFNFQSQTWPVIVTLKIVKGRVVEVRATENAKESRATDGTTEANGGSADPVEKGSEKIQHDGGSQEQRTNCLEAGNPTRSSKNLDTPEEFRGI